MRLYDTGSRFRSAGIEPSSEPSAAYTNELAPMSTALRVERSQLAEIALAAPKPPATVTAITSATTTAAATTIRRRRRARRRFRLRPCRAAITRSRSSLSAIPPLMLPARRSKACREEPRRRRARGSFVAPVDRAAAGEAVLDAVPPGDRRLAGLPAEEDGLALAEATGSRAVRCRRPSPRRRDRRGRRSSAGTRPRAARIRASAPRRPPRCCRFRRRSGRPRAARPRAPSAVRAPRPSARPAGAPGRERC